MVRLACGQAIADECVEVQRAFLRALQVEDGRCAFPLSDGDVYAHVPDYLVIHA